ncbi:ADP-ribosylation factor-like 6 interacting protein 5a [Limanda limanda]|uniref:ADP-ribosylation factor-like 6 interacting protein 5a n=1 Tax=Limanda limanda TaxID=27771 RepID=UPI0029C7AA21|nr:ADP-ribosylation factor-like 6 interacting protein 5a [Limanda limanda]
MDERSCCQIRNTLRRRRMAKVELTPLRPWDDFFPGSERFAKPDMKDLTKWNNRVVSNLLYYQTNYLALAVVVFLIVGFLNPLGMFTAMAVVSGVFLSSVWAGENRAVINNFKRQSPTAFLIAVMIASYLLISMLGSVMVFMTAITLPLAFIFAHSSFRLRNMKNKLENKIEGAGLKRSPMGLLLEALGQQEENFQKIQSFLEGKLTE